MNQGAQKGYRKRPWELTVLAVFFALVPVFALSTRFAALGDAGAVLSSLFGTVVYGPWGVAHAVASAILWLLFWAVAWGIWRVVRWGFGLCIAAAVGNLALSAIVYSVTSSSSGVQESLGFNPFQLDVLLNLIFFVPVLIILRQKVLAPFFNPSLKWWEQHPRVRALLTIDATIRGQSHTYQSFDISASGMFLGTEQVPDLAVGDHFDATIRLEQAGELVEVDCTTVWISNGKGRQPVGCGVTFRYRKRGQKANLARYIKHRIRGGERIERT